MHELWLITLATFPAYLVPLIVEMRRHGVSASSIFFLYSFLGTWLYGFLLSTRLLPEEHVIAPWVVKAHDIPWPAFALINFAIFCVQLYGRPVAKSMMTLRIGRLRAFTIVTLALTFAYIALSAAAHGGIGQWVARSYSRTVIENSALNFLFPVATFTSVASIVLYAVNRHQMLSRSTSRLIVACCILQALTALAAGGRSILLLYLVSLMVAHGRPKIPKWLIYTAAASVFVAASGLIIYVRYQQQGASTSFELNPKNVISASYTGLPFVDHVQLSRVYVEEFGHDYGATLMSVVTLPIPRSLWPEKPLQISRRFREVFWGDSSGGIPPGLFGESYIGFGWLGIGAIALVYAYALRQISRRYRLRSGEPYQIAVIAVVGSAAGFVLVRGGLDIGIYRVGLILASLWLCSRVLFHRHAHDIGTYSHAKTR